MKFHLEKFIFRKQILQVDFDISSSTFDRDQNVDG